MVHCGAKSATVIPMATKEKKDATMRASISFAPDLYHALEDIARRKKVSLAWVIRDAAEQYVAARSASSKIDEE